jgi:hypothetical protein
MPAHYLRPPGKAPQPSRVLLLCAAYTAQADGAPERSYARSRLESWVGANIGAPGSGDYAETYGTAADSPSLWEWVTEQAATRGQTWVIASRMHRLLASTDWYAAAERGEWDYGQTDGARQVANKRNRNARFRGYIVVSDTPTLVLARHLGSGRVVQLLDAGNWGYDCDNAMDSIGG